MTWNDYDRSPATEPPTAPYPAAASRSLALNLA
jgi:hypothetical protein